MIKIMIYTCASCMLQILHVHDKYITCILYKQCSLFRRYKRCSGRGFKRVEKEERYIKERCWNRVQEEMAICTVHKTYMQCTSRFVRISCWRNINHMTPTTLKTIPLSLQMFHVPLTRISWMERITRWLKCGWVATIHCLWRMRAIWCLHWKYPQLHLLCPSAPIGWLTQEVIGKRVAVQLFTFKSKITRNMPWDPDLKSPLYVPLLQVSMRTPHVSLTPSIMSCCLWHTTLTLTPCETGNIEEDSEKYK